MRLYNTIFLLLESALYLHILLTNSSWSMFLSIVLCFTYALSRGKAYNPWILSALGCTMAADFFLVLRPENQRIYGMFFFLAVQILYAIRLQCSKRNNLLLLIRIFVILVAVTVTIIVLKEATDALAIVSLCYYANLVCNVIESGTQGKKQRLFCIGLVLFLFCDTVIGLQQMGGYLTLGANPLLHNILYPGFNLAWLFYLPSQTLIALSGNNTISEELQ